MKIVHLFLSILLFSSSPFIVAQYQKGERTIPCKTQAIAKACYWTHGRLGFGNGTPALRLWKIGTNRILGIYSGPSTYNPHAQDPDNGDNEAPQLPLNVISTMYRSGPHQLPSRIFADFEICPLEPERSGAMQVACVQSAKNIVLEK